MIKILNIKFCFASLPLKYYILCWITLHPFIFLFFDTLLQFPLKPFPFLTSLKIEFVLIYPLSFLFASVTQNIKLTFYFWHTLRWYIQLN